MGKCTLVVVLGMHRSGTSCVTSALWNAGLFLGSQVAMPQDDSDTKGVRRSVDNMDGYYEAEEAVAINNLILERSGGSWDCPPAELVVDSAVDARVANFLDTLRTRPIAGWKDPRTVLTFPRWLPHLKEFRIVGCLRNPLNVAKSLNIRQSISLERGLELWTAYNERLLDQLNTFSESVVIDFDASPDALNDSLVAVAEFLELPRPWAALQSFNQFLRHHSATEPLTNQNCKSLYEILAARAVKPGSLRSKTKFFNPITTDVVSLQRTEALHRQAMRSSIPGPTVISDGAGLLTLTGAENFDFPFDPSVHTSVHTFQALSETAANLQKATEQLSRVSCMQNELMQELWSVREQLRILARIEPGKQSGDTHVEPPKNRDANGFVGMLLRRAASICRRAPKTGHLDAPLK
jgi:hypothetical protein